MFFKKFFSKNNPLSKMGADSAANLQKKFHIITSNTEDNTFNPVYTDHRYDLMWQREDDGVLKTYDEAKAYSEALNLNGYNDWRIPSLAELISLFVSKVDSNLLIDTDIFPNTKSDPYWTSSLHSSCVYDAIIFDKEKYHEILFTTLFFNSCAYVRCVRGYNSDISPPWYRRALAPPLKAI